METENPNDQKENLHPGLLNPRITESKEEKIEQFKLIESWIDGLAKEIQPILEKNNIKSYVLSFPHQGMGEVFYISNLSGYNAAKLSAVATRKMKQEIIEDLST